MTDRAAVAPQYQALLVKTAILLEFLLQIFDTENYFRLQSNVMKYLYVFDVQTLLKLLAFIFLFILIF